MNEIKTIDKLPRSCLVTLARQFGYKAWTKEDKKIRLRGVSDKVTDWELADFISRSI